MLTTRRQTFLGGLYEVLFPTLRRLGGSLGVNYCCRDSRGDGVQEVQAVFVSCSREAWVAAFGRPHHVRRHFDSLNDKWLWSWEHPLPDGALRCIGHLFERAPGRHWIVVKQLRFSQQLSAQRHPGALEPNERGEQA